MEDFFKNKFNDPDSSTDGWDIPDTAVWERAKQQIVLTNKLGYFTWKSLAIISGITVFLFLSGYLWWQNHEIKTLKIELNQQKEKNEQALKTHDSLEKKYEEEKSRLLTEKEYVGNEKKLITEQMEKLEETVSQQRAVISQLKSKEVVSAVNARSANNTEIVKENKIEILPSEKEETKQSVKVQNLKYLQQKSSLLYLSKIPELNTSTQIKPVKKKKGTFEIGYEYAWTNVKMPANRDFKDLKSTAENSTKNIFNAHTNGINFAFSLNRNLFITTGFRGTSFEMEQNLKTGLFYDESKEYQKTDGTTGNDFELNLNTPYAVQRSTIGVNVPEDKDLKSGDVLVIYLQESQKIRSYQVPLGLQYFFGLQNLQWYLEGGMQWNKTVVSDYQIITKFEDDKSEELFVEKIEYDSQPSFSKQFISTYARVGLNYKLAHNWYARAGYQYQFNFIKNNLKGVSSTELNSTSINLGLNYRF